MARTTKLIVLLWTGAALGAEVYFARSAWTALPVLAASAFVCTAAATAVSRRSVAIVMTLTYVYPVVVRLVTDQNIYAFAALWMAGLLGAMAPDAVRTGWHVPRGWRPALICWALTIASAATIVVAREFDFTTALVDVRLANSSNGYTPNSSSMWSLHVSLVLLTGILWFDWLFGLRDQDFRPAVAWPLALSALPLVLVALYQLFVDVTFFNPTEFRRFGRATGTVMDANVCGTLAALWIGGAALLLLPMRVAGRVLVLVAATGGCVLAVWASGSRTALAAAIIVLAFVARDLLRSADFRTLAPRPVTWMTAGVTLAALSAVLYVVVARGTSATGPLERLQDLLPDRSRALSGAAAELWDRDGYGAIAADMIRFAPLFGIGVGSFHVMQADYARLAGSPVLSPDNAQNWFRHQLAEFGLIGSIGWMAWVLAFGRFVLRPHAGARPHADIARGMVIAFAAISLVGMPGQELPTAITFWTSAFWYASLAGPHRGAGAPLRLWHWFAIIGVVAIFSAGAFAQARTTLRVPVRAQQGGWDYGYGLYPPEPDGAGGEARWTARDSVVVLEAHASHLEVTVTPNPLAMTTTQRLVVRIDGCPVIDERASSTAPITRLVRLGGATRRIVFETHTDRTYRPSDVGLPGRRPLGMRVRWRFIEGHVVADQPLAAC